MANEARLHWIQTLSPREDPLALYYTGTLRGGEQALLYKRNESSLTYILRFQGDGALQNVQEREDINWYEDYPVIAAWLEGIGFTPGGIRVRAFSIHEPFDAHLRTGFPRHYSELESLGYDEARADQMRHDWVAQGNCLLRLHDGEWILDGEGWGERR